MRHGIPIAGNFLQQELAILTGAVDVMLVDVQCVFPALAELQKCFHTKVVSTSPKAKFPDTLHIEFHEEHGDGDGQADRPRGDRELHAPRSGQGAASPTSRSRWSPASPRRWCSRSWAAGIVPVSGR